jgi:hypothetical protein
MSVKTFLGEDVDVIRSKFGKLEKRGGGGDANGKGLKT